MVEGLGARLSEQRLLLNISQKKVAEALGVSPAIISNYENGERTPSVENLMAMASLYKCTTDHLLGMDKPSRVLMLDVSMLSQPQVQLLQRFLDSLQN